MEGKFYGAEKFNPRLIMTQIVVMQSLFWLCLCLLTACADFVIGEPQSMSQLFNGRSYTWDTRAGLTLAVCLWATALLMAGSLRFVVERAKKCLDFVCTYHFFHFVATSFASGCPSTGQWWAIQLVALLLAVFLGEYICMMAETKAIKLGSKARQPKSVLQQVVVDDADI